MEKVEILIIGAGVIGLAIGKTLAPFFSEVVVTEKETSFGRETSSRNSEVIHSGIYYPNNSLKAALSVRGNKMLYRYAEERNIPFKKTGKLVVAGCEDEFPALEALFNNGQRNSVPDLKMIDKDVIDTLESQIKAKKALYVPSTGIIDTHNLMQSFASDIEDSNGFIVYRMEATAIEKAGTGFIVTFSNGEQILCKYLINSAGLHSDRIAAKAGLDIVSQDLQLHWCKGEYYKTTSIKGIHHLIYPLPDPKGISLGIHLTLNLNNEIRFGPNAYYVENLEYGMDESYKEQFLTAIQRYLSIKPDDIHPDDTGIRPKLQAVGEPVRDFYIREESDNNLPGLINLIGIESPGLTAALAIGEYVNSLLQ